MYHGSSAAATALWTTVDSGSVIKHDQLVKSLYYEDEAGDVPIHKSYYRLDPFSQFSSFAGFNYGPPCSANVRSFGVTSLKAYPTFKRQHYHRQASGSQHTKSLSPTDLFCFGNKAKNFTSFIDVCRDLGSNNSYGARLELTLNYKMAIAQESQLMDAMTNAFDYVTVQPTADLCLLLSNRAHAISLAAENILSQNRDRYAPSRLSLVCLLSFLSSTIMSRGNECSGVNRKLMKYLSDVRCPLSDLALLPLSLKFNRNGHVSLVKAFHDNFLKAIFGKDYCLVENVPNGTPANTAETQQTCHLEVSFGFVGQSVPTPGGEEDAVMEEVEQGDEDEILLVEDFSLAIFNFSISTSGNFNHVISAFRRHYIGSAFCDVLIRCWLHEFLSTM